MRLIVAILWSLATLMWLPWFALFVRFVIDLAGGVAFSQSQYLNPALVPIWPVRGWLSWGIVSWWALGALIAILLTYVGWRFFWWADDWRPSYKLPTVVATTLIPPAALVLLYIDTRWRFWQRNARLRAGAQDSLAETDEMEQLRVLLKR